MNELPDTQVLSAGRHPASPVFMDGREGFLLRRRENADQIDDRVGPLDRRLDSLVIENVGRDVLGDVTAADLMGVLAPCRRFFDNYQAALSAL